MPKSRAFCARDLYANLVALSNFVLRWPASLDASANLITSQFRFGSQNLRAESLFSKSTRSMPHN